MSKQRSKGSFRAERLDLSEALARSAEPGVVIIDDSRRIAVFNLLAERVTQLHAADVVGDRHDVLPEPLRAIIDEVFQNGSTIVDRSLVLQRDGKSRTVLQANALPVRSGNGDALGVLLTFHDLTSAREFELKVERLQRLASLGVVSAGVFYKDLQDYIFVSTFDEVRDEIRRQLERRATVAAAEQAGRAKLALLEAGKSDKEAGLVFAAPVDVNRNQAGAVFTPDSLSRIFQADPTKLPAYVSGVNPRGGFTIYRVSEVSEPPVTDEARVKLAASRMGEQLGREFLSAYLASLRSRTDVTIDQVALEKR